MSRRRLMRSALAAAGSLALALTSALGGSAPTAKAVAQSERINERIASLLAARARPEPLPLNLPNPFLVVTGTISSSAVNPAAGAAPAGITAAPERPPEDVDALNRYAATLKIGGVMRMGGQAQIVINDVARKEGDIITARVDNVSLRIQVVRIQQNELLLRLNDAEKLVRF